MGDNWIRASTQKGQRLATRTELLAAGVPETTVKSWLRTGRLHVAFEGVYAIGYPVLSREERWLAAVLACGPGAALSHLSAAALWQVIAADGELPDVSAARGRKGKRGIDLHRRSGALLTTVHRGIPVTAIEQTLFDLAVTFAKPALERAVGEAQLSPFFDPRELDRMLADGVRRRGAAPLRAVWETEHGRGVPRNEMERRFFALVGRAGLPRPDSNVPRGRWNIDAFWRDERTAVARAGRDVHTRKAQFQRDREKDRELQLDGLMVLRYTWSDLTRRAEHVMSQCTLAHRSR